MFRCVVGHDHVDGTTGRSLSLSPTTTVAANVEKHLANLNQEDLFSSVDDYSYNINKEISKEAISKLIS